MNKVSARRRRIVGQWSVLAAAACAATIAPQFQQSARAADGTWVGQSGTDWASGDNWNAASVPGAVGGNTSPDTAIFSLDLGAIGGGSNVALPDAGRNVRGINFDTNAIAYTVGDPSGNVLTLTAGGAIQLMSTLASTTVTETIAGPLSLAGNYSFLNLKGGATQLNIAGNVTAPAAATLTLGGIGSVNVSGNVSGAISVVKDGTGIATLTGGNTYAGTTTVNNGVLLFGAAASVGGAGASVNVGANGAVGSTAGLAASGILARINNTGTGTLALTAADSASNLDFTSAPLNAFANWYLGGGDGSTFTGTITPAAGGYRFGGNGSLTVGTNLSGSSALVVGNGSSSGVITFTGNNTYTGGTSVNSGVAVFATPAAIGGSGQTLQVNAPGAVASGTGLADPTFLARISPTSTGALAITAADAATNFNFTTAPFNAVPNMAIGANGDVTYTGTITPANATYRLGGGNGALTLPNANQLTGANSLAINGGTVVLGSIVRSPLNPNFTGNTTVTNATLRLTGGSGGGAGNPVQTDGWLGTAGTVTLNNATLQLAGYNTDVTSGSGGGTWGTFVNPVVVPAGSNSTIALSYRGSFAGSLSGAGTVTMNVPYIRTAAQGNWGAFTGQINIVGVGTLGHQFEINTAGAANAVSAPNAKVFIDNTRVYLTQNPPNGGATNSTTVISWGELSGTATAELGGQPVAGRHVLYQVGSLNTDSTFAGTITNQARSIANGNSGLAKVGTGTLTLTGNNTYLDPTTITGGTLQLGNGGTSGTLGVFNVTVNSVQVPTSAATTVTSPGILAFNRSDTFTVYSAIGGTGQVVKNGTGTTILQPQTAAGLASSNTYTGGTLVNAGTLQGTPAGLTGTITVASGASLNFDGAGTTAAIAAGTGTVNKINAGAVKFSNPQTFSGALNVLGGSLEFTGANAAHVVVANGAALTASAPNAFSLASLQLGSSGGDSTVLNVNNGTVPTGFSVTDNNGLVANGNVTLNLGTINLTPGVYTLLDYVGSIGGAGASAFHLSPLPPRVIGGLVNNPATTALELNITAVDMPRWNGNVNGNWDINSTQNWRLVTGGGATTYLQPTTPGDSVLFDDNATGTTTVNITTAVAPAAVTVNNTAKAYTFSGSGKITGATALIKQGAGSLTISNTGGNDYTGGTQILGGTVTLGTSNALPVAGAIKVDNGATLNLGGNSHDTSGAVSVVNGTISNGTINKSGAAYDIQAGTVSATLAGSAGLIKSGDGTAVILTPTTYGGTTNVNGGTLQYGNGTATVSIPAAINNTGTVNWKIAGTDAIVYGGQITGSGAVVLDIAAGASLEINNAGQGIAGPTTVNGGTLILTGTGAGSTPSKVGSPLTLNTGATLIAKVGNALGIATPPNPVTSLTLNPGSVAIADAGSSHELYGLTLAGGKLSGPGQWNIRGNPTVTADSLIDVATLGMNGDRTLSIPANVTVTVNSTFNSGSALTKTGAGTLLFNGPVTGAGAVNLNAGAISVAADTSVPATLNFNGGTLRVTGTTLTSLAGKTLNTTALNGTIDVADAANVFTLSQDLSGTSAIGKAGPGTLILSGNNTQTGATTITAGTLQVDALARLGTGKVNVNGGQLVVTDAAAIAAIETALDAAYNHGKWDGATGIGSTNALMAANERTLGYGLVGGQAVVMFTLPGDANLDGTVNRTDLNLMTTGADFAHGDFNYDNRLSADDFALWAVGAAIGSLPAETAVPEPAALGVIGAAATLLGSRRRRSR